MSCNKFWETSDNMWQLWQQYRWLTRQRWISYDIICARTQACKPGNVQLASNSRFSCSAPSHLGISDVAMLSHVLARGWECLFVSTQHSMHWLHANVMYLPLPSHVFISTYQHWHKGNALYYMVRDIREATVAPLRRMKAANQRYCSRHLGTVLASQIHSASGRVDFSAAQQAEGISGQACLTAWTRSCRQLQQLAQKRQTEHHVFRERVPWQER